MKSEVWTAMAMEVTVFRNVILYT